MFEVPVSSRPAKRLRTMVGDEAGARYDDLIVEARKRLRDRCVWHINATVEGGGVAEILSANLGYLADDGIPTRWLVIEAEPTFFEITKRIHNRLHGVLGDGGPLGDAERRHYGSTSARELEALRSFVRPGDVVVVHDPQPLGLVPGLREIGATVVWTCHVGVDIATDIVRSAWSFLREDLRAARAATFTRRAYVWDGLEALALRTIPPCIDPLSAKNVALSGSDIPRILGSAGIFDPPPGQPGSAACTEDGRAIIRHEAQMTERARTPPDAPLVLQVSRWDALKDPVGVMIGFARSVRTDAHLILAGPAPSSVVDDPEADHVFTEVRQAWLGLDERARTRVHLANLPIEDPEENAVVVNALQSRADVVVQKSMAEGFGLTVTEAMWKARPVVAGGVGGIREQIDDGVNGVLVDPRDLGAFGSAVTDLLQDPERAASLGAEGRRSVQERFLPTRYLADYLGLFLELIGKTS